MNKFILLILLLGLACTEKKPDKIKQNAQKFCDISMDKADYKAIDLSMFTIQAPKSFYYVPENNTYYDAYVGNIICSGINIFLNLANINGVISPLMKMNTLNHSNG